ncbi:putative hydrolase [Hartmannibacter diazotrophicus]|uniref:Putative hydrolase n=1 Tax=Hartmannibacter diazotrophicus TaxID=1482074 RepID=A0A2C9D8Z8_9HYPH|nr:Zn-dependent hydrolase [Hartmannibacter diazotrophicus]SON56628.1 putative hydrolase [Hartmannibacter diazotrophicus]
MTSISSLHERFDPAQSLPFLLSRFAAFGATRNGGVTRLCASPEDGDARSFFKDALTSAGAKVLTDAVGNQFGIFSLTDRPDAPIVMMGSHLDSQSRGGKLDGALGVAASLCVGQSLLDAKRGGTLFDANFCVVNWTNEEGARFRPSLLGSSSYVGLFSTDYVLDRRDDDGISLGEALSAIGYRGMDTPPQLPGCYLELHVEQGTRLEEMGAQIGIVTRNWGAVKFQAAFLGEQAHTGPTAMERRKDALLGAAHAIIAVREIADRWAGIVHTSVGRIQVEPNSSNVVAARVEISIEVRSSDDAVLSEVAALAEKAIEDAAERARVRAEIESRSDRKIRELPHDVCNLIALCASEGGHESLQMDTIAGHDAISLLGICPTGLIFVPSIAGISHNEAEATDEADLAAGLDVCIRAAERLCRAGASPQRAVLIDLEASQ